MTSAQKPFVMVLTLAVLFVQASAWDEKDLRELRVEADKAKENGIRWLVERSGYRDVYTSEFHCRAPRQGERLVMQHANPRDAGKGYRCTYWLTSLKTPAQGVVTWSRSPELVQHLADRSAR